MREQQKFLVFLAGISWLVAILAIMFALHVAESYETKLQEISRSYRDTVQMYEKRVAECTGTTARILPQ